MTYHTDTGVKRKITENLYDETALDDRIEDTGTDVVAWVNSAVNRTVDFTEEELTGDDSIIRLASDCYCAFRIMSEMLEGHNMDNESLATVRYNEAKTYIRMWCANEGIVPAFDDDSASDTSVSTEVGASFAYNIGTDRVCIG